jgi:hypothetical protein
LNNTRWHAYVLRRSCASQNGINEILDYQVTDVNGRILMIGELVDEKHIIDFTQISSGIYFIKITNTKTQEYIVRKIVK